MEVLKWLIPSLAALYCIICLGMWIFQERFVFFPYPVPGDTTYEFSGVWEEQLLNRGNGVLLHTVLFRSKESKGLIFHSHGNAGILKYW